MLCKVKVSRVRRFNPPGGLNPDVRNFSKFIFELFGPTINCGAKHPVVLKNFVLVKHPNGPALCTSDVFSLTNTIT